MVICYECDARNIDFLNVCAPDVEWVFAFQWSRWFEDSQYADFARTKSHSKFAGICTFQCPFSRVPNQTKSARCMLLTVIKVAFVSIKEAWWWILFSSTTDIKTIPNTLITHDYPRTHTTHRKVVCSNSRKWYDRARVSRLTQTANKKRYES